MNPRPLWVIVGGVLFIVVGGLMLTNLSLAAATLILGLGYVFLGILMLANK